MKGVIFDLDGTMVDNMMIHHKAWQETLSELGLEMSIEEVMERVHGINEEILARLFKERFTFEERTAISAKKEKRYRELFAPQLTLLDGLHDFLHVLKSKKIPMAVATAAPKINMDFIIDNLEIRSLFKATLHAGHVTKGKPDPEVFLKAAQAIRVDPKDCVVFEDSPTGAKAAVAAGCSLVVVTTTHQHDDFQGITVDKFISNYIDLSIGDI
ncbi:HAD family hydrolase [Fulvivirga lutimaris]|uniref:HAD family hydrolase n=1 Tax=Fulvivirga lutimaris TaxID=1819566 RepID=UPI0012BC06EA|nr:HAD family phosphatase [Fulvivirga lutimaris]MTI41759.1 HAD family phosphatase [Fulvivirga lutimaris]